MRGVGWVISYVKGLVETEHLFHKHWKEILIYMPIVIWSIMPMNSVFNKHATYLSFLLQKNWWSIENSLMLDATHNQEPSRHHQTGNFFKFRKQMNRSLIKTEVKWGYIRRGDHKIDQYIINKHQILHHINTSKNYRQPTFKLPEQEQGDSIFESISSSWHILHSTSFLGDKLASESLW